MWEKDLIFSNIKENTSLQLAKLENNTEDVSELKSAEISGLYLVKLSQTTYKEC